ncbi:hypothetical protein VNI00_011154 [Paramarasmius palmivorus]|uniref:Uncharacterized protein n=1 Tax=Paramarasmius palmivorus TaxID=297713 RepID=A0AAW0CH75_9AGAR
MDDSLSLNVQNSQLYITIINGNHNRTINGSELALPHPQSSTDLGRGVPSKRSPSMTSANVERGEEGAAPMSRDTKDMTIPLQKGCLRDAVHTDTAGSEQDSTRSSKERSRSRRKLKGGLLATLFMLSLKKMVSLPLSPSPSPSPPPPAPATPPPPTEQFAPPPLPVYHPPTHLCPVRGLHYRRLRRHLCSYLSESPSHLTG